jgi:hypothetical protein
MDVHLKAGANVVVLPIVYNDLLIKIGLQANL